MRCRLAPPESGHRHLRRLIAVVAAAVTVLSGAAAVYVGTDVSFFQSADQSCIIVGPFGSASAGARLHGSEFADESGSRVYVSQIAQSGVIADLSDHSATVVSYDGFTQTYALKASMTITDLPQRGERALAESLRVGDWVLIEALRTATEPIAVSVTRGSAPLGLLTAPSGGP